MKEIGGYIELEFRPGNFYHKNAVVLNTARNCFEYILKAKEVRKVFIPHYTCEVMLEPVNKLGVEYEYYHIDSNLEPKLSFKDQENTFLLYTNYFGIKQNFIKRLSEKVKNLIIDDAQAFYQPQVGKADTFYSARKFFGVPDGAYLYTDKILTDIEIEQDYSFNRVSHLVKRIEMGSNAAYQDFLENDYTLYNQPIKKMSEFSQTILSSFDYNTVKTKRERNFLYMHINLSGKNELEIDLADFSAPMFYPFLLKSEKIRQHLIENKIYVPTLWKNVFNTTDMRDFEQYLANYLYPLPIDQRYEITDMEYIISVLRPFI